MWIAIFVILFLLLAYLFLIMPRIFGKADMDSLNTDYAHRGLWNEQYPENSLAAFARAASVGYGIELDVQLSKDKRIMVFHDATLKRMCGVDGKLSDYTCEELQKMKLLGSEYTIPTFVDVLRTVNGRVPLLVELKGETTNTELCKRIAPVLDKYRGQFCVESFNPFLLAWFKKYRPRYARGQLVTKMTHKTENRNAFVNFVLSNMLTNVLSRPDFIATGKNIRNTPMIYICESVFRSNVFVWTVNQKEEYVTCRKEGRHAIFEKILPKTERKKMS